MTKRKKASETETKPVTQKYKSHWRTEELDRTELEGRMNNLIGCVQMLEWFAGERPDLVANERGTIVLLAARLHSLANDPEEHYRVRQAKMAAIEI